MRGSSAYSRTSTAWPSNRLLLDVQRLALRDAQLLLDQVDAGDELGHRMLDLDPPVQLEEPEVAAGEHELGRARAAVADRVRERDGRLADLRRGAPGRARATALPRAPSGGGAAPSTRAPRARRPCRGHRRAAGSRCVAAARRNAPRRPCRRRTRPRPRGSRRRAPRRARPCCARRACRGRRRPPPLSGSAGSRAPAGSPDSTTGTPASRATCFERSLSPAVSSASGVGPTQMSPAASTARAKSAFSARKP